jgi:metallo-beta-lactamase class B
MTLLKTAVIILSSMVSLSGFCLAQDVHQTFTVSEDLQIVKISEHCYVHISYLDAGAWNHVPCNGLICVDRGEALLFDTPPTDSITQKLIAWIGDSLHARIVGFAPNHWHVDCMGGLKAVHEAGIPSYAYELTKHIAVEKKLPVPDHAFKVSKILHAGSLTVVCEYFGAAHTTDNIVTWVPSENVLFPGCMVKELKAKNLGNIEDADLVQWPATLARIQKQFYDAKIVVPGHGDYGGLDLIQHTVDLLKK